MKNRRKGKGEQTLQYNLTIWKKNNYFDIQNIISEDVTLVQLMDSLGILNQAIGVVVYWIFYSNYDKVILFDTKIVGYNML